MCAPIIHSVFLWVDGGGLRDKKTPSCNCIRTNKYRGSTLFRSGAALFYGLDGRSLSQGWFRLSVSLMMLTAKGITLFKPSRGYLSPFNENYLVNPIIQINGNLSTIFNGIDGFCEKYFVAVKPYEVSFVRL